MAVTLAQPRGPSPAVPIMEKLLIEGGVPLSGTIVPAGNKNAALPLLACSLLTDEEVVLHNVPRIRDVEAMLELLADLGVRTEWRDGEHRVAAGRPGARAREVSAVIAERIRASFLAAGPLLAPLRLGRDAAAGRRRDRPPPARSPPRRVPRPRRDRRARARHPDRRRRRRPAGVRLLHGRAVGDGHRERADGVGADRRHDRDPQRRVRAARAGPRAHAQQDGRRDRGHRLQRDAGPRHGQARRLRAHRQPRPHRDRLVHGARGRHRRRAADRGLRAGRHADDPARVRAPRAAQRARRRRLRRPGRTRSSSWRATPATTRSRSRTARGRRSRPTSRASPSRSPRSPRARC